MTDDQEHRRPPLDEPTVLGPASGDLGPQPEEPTVPDHGDGQPDEPTSPDDAATTSHFNEAKPASSDEEPTLADPATPDTEATIAGLVAGANSPTVFEPVIGGWWSDRDEQPATGDEPTLAEPGRTDDEATVRGDDEPTLAVGTDEPTTTGPTVGSWPFDQFEAPPPGELIWRAEAPPAVAPVAARNPAYYVALGAAVVLVVGLVALATFVSVVRPRQVVAGDAVGRGGVPEITTSSVAPPPTTSTTQPGPFAELAAQPLSSATARMPDATCSLPRFDPADDKQADFYAAAKVCADAAWRPVLSEAGLEGDVTVVTLTGPAQTQTCGDLAPDSPPTQCDGTVYLTPAYLRDTEQNGRYPGRYLGVFFREYARALQFTNGIDELVGASSASGADLDTRVEQQATCLAGVMAGAMAGRGAIDSNITGEVRDRLSAVDAPAGARDWLDKGFQQRTPAACNSWAG